ncbi:hypothetical protein fugu_009089 [Takifugu bimaculatus]|uniref:PH domain-containing protein n=1 Tax=Takifugu bimaculatus TaxID=433685 RepID=A0A4Z2AXX8_9TELE|nr:hypothetical protein fugu_009089 [Takifugu bimaculatus]
MNEIHRGTLRMYSGFIFKQWKKRFLLLTSEGALTVSHDASSPPDQLVLVQSSCEAIVEGKEILDLPRLPAGGCRDCCFALILPQNKYLLLLTETSSECSQWLNMLRKVKNSLSSPVSHCKRHQVSLPRIILRDLAPEQVLDKDPPTPPVCDLGDVLPETQHLRFPEGQRQEFAPFKVVQRRPACRGLPASRHHQQRSGSEGRFIC